MRNGGFPRSKRLGGGISKRVQGGEISGRTIAGGRWFAGGRSYIIESVGEGVIGVGGPVEYPESLLVNCPKLKGLSQYINIGALGKENPSPFHAKAI